MKKDLRDFFVSKIDTNGNEKIPKNPLQSPHCYALMGWVWYYSVCKNNSIKNNSLHIATHTCPPPPPFLVGRYRGLPGPGPWAQNKKKIRSPKNIKKHKGTLKFPKLSKIIRNGPRTLQNLWKPPTNPKIGKKSPKNTRNKSRRKSEYF